MIRQNTHFHTIIYGGTLFKKYFIKIINFSKLLTRNHMTNEGNLLFFCDAVTAFISNAK